MNIYNLDKIFKPSSVAVIGASEKKGSIGYSLIKNLIEAEYPGKVLPVNPNYRSIQGFAAYHSIRKIGEPVDLAIIAVPLADPMKCRLR